MTTDLTPFEVSALGWALDQAYAQRLDYQTYGNPDSDYGDEWPETANSLAAECTAAGRAGEKLGFSGERERWDGMAHMLLASAHEFRNPAFGN